MPADSQNKQEMHRNSADAMGDQKRSDPLRLTFVVVDKILEHLDDRSLLTGRMVCRSWNEEITSRNYQWKQRCQRKHVFRFNLSTTPLDDVFHQYVRFHHVYHRMRSGDALQVDKQSETLSQIFGRRIWDNSFKKLFVFPDQIWLGNDTILFSTVSSELVMADLKTQTELWRQADVKLFFYNQFCPHTIYAVTLSGDVKLFSLEGKCDLQIHTGGKLKDARFMFQRFHFIVVELDNDEVHIVDIDNNRVVKLHLVFPQIPKDDDESDNESDDESEEDGDVGEEEEESEEDDVGEEEEESEEDGDVGEEEEEDGDVGEEEEEASDPSLAIGFLLNNSLSREQLAVCLCKEHSMVVAIINTDGKILHQASRTFSRWLSWNESDLFNKLDSNIIVKTNEWIEKYAIHCTPSGIQFNLLWQKPFPDRLLARHAQTLMCGDQFILGQEGHSLLLCRLSDGQLVLSIPEFFRTRFSRLTSSWRLVDVSGESPELVARRIEILQFCRSKTVDSPHLHNLFLNNTSWLNGLSPATTQPDVPVLMYVPDVGAGIKCLRWSADLWTGNDLQVQQQERGNPETGLGLRAEIEHWN